MNKKNRQKFVFAAAAFFILVSAFAPAAAAAKSRKSKKSPFLNARSAVVVDASSGRVIYSKNPGLRLPPASTTKVMTAVLVLERLPLDRRIKISRYAAGQAPSKAGLTPGESYDVKSLLIACLVSSSNDAAVALAEGVAGSEADFVVMMNEKAKSLGMSNTKFINATGLPIKGRKQYSTANDLVKLMRFAIKNPRIDGILGINAARFWGTDGRVILIRSHNKMLWKAPGLVKGKTGWTFASRHTFVGTDCSYNKKIALAMLSSTEPWKDIERLARMA